MAFRMATAMSQDRYLVTHETTEADVRKAVDAVLNDGHLVSKPQVIRIEPARSDEAICQSKID
jgi:homoserine dehydrogenase